MNLSELAKAVSEKEGGKKQLNIGEIREVLRCLGDVLYENDNATKIAKKLYYTAKVRAEKKLKKEKKS